MPMYDFVCACGTETEEIIDLDECSTMKCPACSKTMQRIWKKSPALPTTIIIAYPGSKRLKAGYVHTHGDRPATKLQSGPGGMARPAT